MKKIVVQGLGYVGLAMMSFCAGAKKNNKYLYDVIGVEKKTTKGLKILEKINSHQVPEIVDDKSFSIYNKLRTGSSGYGKETNITPTIV